MQKKTDNSSIRRYLLIIVLVLWVVVLWLFLKSRSPVSAVVPDAVYKVRAYTTSKEKAGAALKSAKSLGMKGSMSKCRRTISKFMGYIVEQDFTGDSTINKADSIKGLLKSKGYSFKIIKHPNEKKLTMRLNKKFRSKEKADKVSEEIFQSSTVTFKVKKHYKKTGYKAFVVVFTGIDNREKAQELKEQLSKYTSDVEMVSY